MPSHPTTISSDVKPLDPVALYALASELEHVTVWAWRDGHAQLSTTGFADEPTTWPELLARLGVSESEHAKIGEAVGTSQGFALEVAAAHEERRWLLVRGKSVAGWLVGTVADVTERHHAAADMRLLQDRLDTATRLTQLSAWEFEVRDDGRAETAFIVGSSAMYSGVNRANRLPDTSLPECLEKVGVIAEDIPKFIAVVQDCIDGRTDEYGMEFGCRRVDGVMTWRVMRGNISMRHPDGRPLRLVGVAVDITSQKLAEEQIRRIQQRLELAIRAAALGTWELDMPDGRLEASAKSFYNVWEPLGYAGGEPSDLTTQLTFGAHPDDRARVRDAIETLLAGREHQFEHELRVVARDGSIRTRVARGLVVRAASGLAVRFTGTLIDITELKRIEGELQEAKRVAEAANRAKDDFLANVSHEIRTPMNAILGMTELTLESPLNDHQATLLKTVKVAANNLLVIINDLLDFAKIEAGKLELESDDFSLRAVIGETMRALAVRAHTKGLELLSDVHPDVPDALIGDPGRLRQVLLNIVGNAIKFTEQGEVFLQAGLDLLASGSEDSVALRISVRDTGVGIPPSEQERIFRAFEQEDTSTTRRFGGTGLGLSIANQLVLLMGGTISVESERGHGSVFVITARMRRQQRAESEPRLPAALRAVRVLVVDDNPTNCEILAQWLRRWGMKPTIVRDGVAAMGALWDASGGQEPYQLVLLDGRMPDTDGWALAARIRERASLFALKIIILSSADRPGDPARSRELRIDAHVLKPALQDELLETIQLVLAKTDDTITARPRMLVSARAADPLHVLVAEDNEFSSQFLEELLTSQGHRVTLATNGRAALELAAAQAFDLLLLDLHMPELDGFAVARAIRKREQAVGGHLTIIALTARSRKEDRDRCTAAGIDDYVAKPVGPAALTSIIDRLLGVEPDLEPALDPVAILHACQDDEAMFSVLARDLPARAEELVTALRAGVDAGDRERVVAVARELATTLRSFSATAADQINELEHTAEGGNLTGAGERLAELEAAVTRLARRIPSLTISRLRRGVRRARG